MQIKVKPEVVKRVTFEVPRGIPNLRYTYDAATGYSREVYDSQLDAIKANSVEWESTDDDMMIVTITPVKDRLLVLIGGGYDNPGYVELGNAYFKLTPTIAKKLIQRALAADNEKTVTLTDAEKEEAKMRRKKGPRFERVAGKRNLFLFTAPCGDISVIRQGTLESMLDAITLAEKELK